MRSLIFTFVGVVALAMLAPSQAYASFFTGTKCCNSTMSSYDTVNCVAGGADGTAATINCTLSIASANHVLLAISGVGNALSTGNAITDTCGSAQPAGNTGAEGINGIGGHFAMAVLTPGSCTGSDTITLTSGPTPDFMYLLVLDYNPNQIPAVDSGGVGINVASSGCGVASTSCRMDYTTHAGNSLLVTIQGWSGAGSTNETLTCNSPDNVDFTALTFFKISAGANKKAFVACSQYQAATGTYQSTAVSNSGSGGWTNLDVAFTATLVASGKKIRAQIY